MLRFCAVAREGIVKYLEQLGESFEMILSSVDPVPASQNVIYLCIEKKVGKTQAKMFAEVTSGWHSYIDGFFLNYVVLGCAF